jgi:hypothetical protein
VVGQIFGEGCKIWEQCRELGHGIPGFHERGHVSDGEADAKQLAQSEQKASNKRNQSDTRFPARDVMHDQTAIVDVISDPDVRWMEFRENGSQGRMEAVESAQKLNKSLGNLEKLLVGTITGVRDEEATKVFQHLVASQPSELANGPDHAVDDFVRILLQGHEYGS